MLPWPDQPIDSIPPEAFVPPHCPWPGCPHHRDPTGFRYRRHSRYFRKHDQQWVTRIRCRTCGGTFSRHTFSVTYYMKRPELLRPIAAGLLAGSAHRQLARSLGCAPSTVTRLSARLGRHALLLLARSLECLDSIPEAIVYDDFESFFFCQEFAVGVGTPVGQRSWFIYGLEHAPHRRGGRRSPAQKKRGKRPFKTPRRPYVDSFRRTLDLLASKQKGPDRLAVITDDHPGYRQGMKHHPERDRFLHRIYRNPKRAHKGAPRNATARRRDREMFAADLLHGLMRHSLSHHGRETIAFSRRQNALLERGFLMAVWRNYVKGRSERRPDRTTPAMAIGLAQEPWNWSRVLAQRLFPGRIRVPESWRRVYRRAIITPEVGRNLRHDLVHAF